MFKMFIKFVIILICVLSGYNFKVDGQIPRTGCPTGWVKFQMSCYNFVSDSPKIFEEADSACWTYGATLLKVDSTAEGTFVANWLLQNDIIFKSTWFTSGFYTDDHVLWQMGQDESMNVVAAEWNEEPHTADIFNHVAYRYSGPRLHRYRWSLVSPSVPSSYICEIPETESSNIGLPHRDFSYGLGYVQPEDLPHGPVMIVEPVGVVVYGRRRTIMLECLANANPPAAYRWYRGQHSTEPVTTETNPRYTLSEGRLTIDDPEQNEDGNFYWCSAENQYGKIISRRAQIMFGFLDSFPPVKPDDVNATAFAGVRISCNTPAYNPRVQYSWFKNFDTHNFVFPNHPYHFVSQSGWLYFSEVQPTDDRKYFCVVTLSHPENMVAESTSPPSRVSYGTLLNIRNAKNDANYGPIIFTNVFPSPPKRGDNIRIECIAYGSLPLKYSWRRADGRPFEKGTILSSRNRVLTIINATLQAEGNYICTVRRTNNVKSSTVALVMETQPYFSDPIGDQLVDPGQRVKWMCKAIGRPKATYAWFKNGEPMQNVPGEISVSANILIIERIVKERDEGMYQCAATNQHGSTYSTGQLKVISIAPNFKRYPMTPSILAAQGGEMTIPCRIEGAPTPEVIWMKDGGNLNLYPGTGDGHFGMTLANALVITDIQMSDQGLYICKGSNINGEATNSTYMKVIHGVVIDRPPIASSVVINTTHFLFCEASHDYVEIDMTYEWQFNGHDIIFHNNPHYIKGHRQGVNGLYIREAQHHHGGLYTCVARTPLHADMKSAPLTVVGPPREPAGVYTDSISVTSYQARVIWTVTDAMTYGAAINAYDIEADTNYNPGEWQTLMTDIQEPDAIQTAVENADRPDQRSAVVTNLFPNTDYRFRVRAANFYGRGKAASLPSASIKTPATKPVRPPAEVGGGGGKVGVLTIKWTPLPPAQQCGPGIGYRVYWRLKEDRPAAANWQKDILEGTHRQYTAIVGEDYYYLQYEVMVGVYNDLGDGPNSTIKVVYSAMGMPVAVPTITDVSGINISTVVITFTPVPDDREHVKGRIKGYTCQYYWNDQGCNPMTGCELTNLRKKNVWGQADQITLIDLEMNSEFFFRMQVINSAGKGPIGEWRRGETATYAPLTYPRFVRITSLSDHSIRVNWQGVATTVNEEIITGYKVKWWEVSADIRNANETTSDRLENSVVIHGLQTKTVYELRVQGVSAGGDGAMSNSVYFTIKGGQIPIDPGNTQICYEDRTCNTAAVLKSNFLSIIVIELLVVIAYYKVRL